MSTEINNNDKALENAIEAVARNWGIRIYPLDVKLINPRPGIRLKCQVPLCEYYGVCKTCPPHIPGVAEFREILREYNKAFLVVLREEIQDMEVYRNDFSAELKLADIVADVELSAFQQGYYQAMGLIVGGCKLCEVCSPPGEPCRHPYQARPSPEGFGIDITELARAAGVTVEWPPREFVSFLGLVLV